MLFWKKYLSPPPNHPRSPQKLLKQQKETGLLHFATCLSLSVQTLRVCLCQHTVRKSSFLSATKNVTAFLTSVERLGTAKTLTALWTRECGFGEDGIVYEE